MQVLVQLIVVDVCIFLFVCGEAFEQLFELPSVDYVNEEACGNPLQRCVKCLSVDVAGLAMCHFIAKVNACVCESLVQPGNTDTVSAPEVSRGWVPAGWAHSDHGLVILVEFQSGRTSDNYIPELSGR